MKNIQVFNGRWKDRMRGYIAAYTKKQAVELANQAGYSMNMRELNNYWSDCWGNAMNDVVPEVGVWVTDQYGRNRERLVDSLVVRIK